jgi:spectrin beta
MTFRDFDRFAKIQQPLVQRREQLVKVKRIHQFIRDVEDEKLWIDEKMPQATSTQYGNSLLSVQMLVTKNQVRLCWSFVVVDN